MFTADWAFVLADLQRQGMVSTLQIEHASTSGRNARGKRVVARAPVGDPVDAFLTTDLTTLQQTGFGRSDQQTVHALLAPCTDCEVDDTLRVVEGFLEGARFRVLRREQNPGPVGAVIVDCVQLAGSA